MKKTLKKSQEKSLAVENDLRNNEVVGNQDKANALIGKGGKIGRKTESVINEQTTEYNSITDLIQDFVLNHAQNGAMPPSDAKIFMIKFCRGLRPDEFDESLVSFIFDTVDAAYQQYPNVKRTDGCTSISYEIQGRTIIEIIGVSPDQAKKISELIYSEGYRNLSKQ